jgi:hypothetical protein
MKKILFSFAASLVAMLTAASTATPLLTGTGSDLIITEISYNPPESGTDSTEYIEILNNGSTTINLNGYFFSSGVIHSFTVNDSITPGQYFVIAVDSSGFRNRFGFNANAIWSSGGLSNGGEPIAIKDNLGALVDSLRYDDASPWPSGSSAGAPDGGGASLVLCDVLADNKDGTNWKASITQIVGQVINGNQVYGSPGASNICLPPMFASIAVDSNVSCNGLSNGGATASASGGTAPYTFTWSNAATTASITGVMAGTYTVTVSDNNGVTASDITTITEPAALIAATMIDSNVSINGGANGGATASATGGTAPYTYAWSNTATTASITGVMAATYTVSITDNNGCSDTEIAVITQPGSLIASAVVDSNVSCNGLSNGGATASATGGTAPYTYNWSNSATTASITGVIAGTYTITVTDNNGATASNTAIVTEPSTLIAGTVIDSNVSVNGGSDGGATASATGGTAPYTYSWSNGATTASITGISAGNYTISITDNNGCSDTEIATITEPAVMGPLADLIFTEIQYNPAESGTDSTEYIEILNNGSSTVSLAGYFFSQGVTHSFTANDSIIAGQYFVIAVDSAGFRNRYGLDANAIWTSGGLSNGGEDITLVDNFGRTVDSVDFDDNSPWPSGSSAGSPDGGGASIILCNILSDNNLGINWIVSSNLIPGQVINGMQVFGNPGMSDICIPPLAATITVDSNISCNGLSDGGATAAVSGGTAPYTYTWSNAATTASITGVSAGTYTLTVTDNNGLTTSDVASITEPAILMAVMTVDSNVSCNGLRDGGVSAAGMGGTAPYSYVWDNSLTSASLTGLPAGTYSVTITDNNACMVSDTVVVTEPAVLSSSSTINACDSFTWTQTGLTYELTGTYSDTVQSSAGCDSILTLYLSIDRADTSVLQVGDSITALGSGSFQWIDCNNNSQAIPGATFKVFYPSVSGSYAVIVSNGSCVDTSECTPVIITGLSDYAQTNQLFEIFPNPTSTSVTIKLGSATLLKEPQTLKLRNISGILIREVTLQSVEQLLSLEDLPEGVYLLEISGSIHRVIKTH